MLGIVAAGYRSGVVDPAIALGLLAKLVSWYDFESNLNDGWGPNNLDFDTSGIAYAAASTGGSGPSGNCLATGDGETQAQLKNVYQSACGIIAMVSTDVFTDNASICGLTAPSATVLAFKERATPNGYRQDTASASGVNHSLDDAGSVIDTWNLLGQEYDPVVGSYLHTNATHRYATFSFVEDLRNPANTLYVGNKGSAVSTSSKIAFFAKYDGALTSAEWTYLWNGGAGRTLSGIISDAGGITPAQTWTATSPSQLLARSYDGLRIASTGAVQQSMVSSIGHSSGKHWGAFRKYQASDITGAFTATIGVGTSDESDRVLIRVDSTAPGTVFVAGAFTAGTDPALGAFAENDIVMWAHDETAKKVWFGKNNVWGGDPGAGTGHAASYTGALTIYNAAFTNGIEFSGEYYLTAADMPYSNPTGFTPWGD